MNLEVLGKTLDKEQTEAAITNDINTIIIAGAGSGKSLTMVGKIKYLVKFMNVPIENILCITFTNEAAKSLEKKITQELNLENKVYTFHKLGLEILSDNKVPYKIAPDDLLPYLVQEIFLSIGPHFYFTFYFLNKRYLYSQEFTNYQKTIIQFIRLFMSKYETIYDFDKIILSAKKRDVPFLKIIKKIYEMYLLEKESSGYIDFDDMVKIATRLVREKGINKKYQYIIIDEYQDTSNVREKLVKEIVKKTKAYLTVVGDDFQSIYRFSGCDIDNFLLFKKHFSPAKELYITHTYRNCHELINIAGSFIMQNKRQIRKELKSDKRILKPIVILYYKNQKTDFIKACNKIKGKDILILGRNNKDILDVLPSSFKLDDNIIHYHDKIMKYMTIHKSKGLEAENVMLINLTNEINSIPSKIKEESILKYIIDKNIYPYEEERRLFYVALTRTKNYCYLFVDKKNPSIFVKELKRKYKKYITIINL